MAEALTSPVRITLMIGPGVAVPVGADVLAALDTVTVEAGSGDTQSGFELTFSLDRGSPLNTLFLLTGGSSIPVVRVVIAVTIRGQTSVLADGVMTHHQLSTPGAGRTTLTMKGKDVSALMDIVELDGIPYPAMPQFIRVLAVLAKYTVIGCVPVAIPAIATDVPLPIDRIPRQQGTDYQYVKSVAAEVGWTFYLDPGPAPGICTAYWGPEIRVGAPQPALNADLDAPDNNVTALSF